MFHNLIAGLSVYPSLLAWHGWEKPISEEMWTYYWNRSKRRRTNCIL